MILLNGKAVVVAILLAFVVLGIFLFKNKEPESNLIQEKYNTIQNPTAKALYFAQSDQLTRPVDKRLVELDHLQIGCFGPSRILSMRPSETNLGGQCCGALKSKESYDAQMSALGQFIAEHGNVPLIPKDPYDVPVALAQELIGYDTSIALTAEQQQMYDEAIAMSHHGGPCCCKCWKWYVMSGLGKKLIVDHGFTAEELAELWDTSSSCGHDDDTNMYTHYKTKE